MVAGADCISVTCQVQFQPRNLMWSHIVLCFLSAFYCQAFFFPFVFHSKLKWSSFAWFHHLKYSIYLQKTLSSLFFLTKMLSFSFILYTFSSSYNTLYRVHRKFSVVTVIIWINVKSFMEGFLLCECLGWVGGSALPHQAYQGYGIIFSHLDGWMDR